MLPEGSFVRIPAGEPHFAWTDRETVVQLNSTGPWTITYVQDDSAAFVRQFDIQVQIAVGPAAVDDEDRVQCSELGEGFYQVIARYGFMETPDVPEILQWCAEEGVPAKPIETTYYLGRERLLPIGTSKMAGWRKKLFVVMSRNARTATEFFGIPPNRVVELGAQIEF